MYEGKNFFKKLEIVFKVSFYEIKKRKIKSRFDVIHFENNYISKLFVFVLFYYFIRNKNNIKCPE